MSRAIVVLPDDNSIQELTELDLVEILRLGDLELAGFGLKEDQNKSEKTSDSK